MYVFTLYFLTIRLSSYLHLMLMALACCYVLAPWSQQAHSLAWIFPRCLFPQPEGQVWHSTWRSFLSQLFIKGETPADLQCLCVLALPIRFKQRNVLLVQCLDLLLLFVHLLHLVRNVEKKVPLVVILPFSGRLPSGPSPSFASGPYNSLK